MEWIIAILAVVVLGLGAVAAAGGLGQFGPIEVDRVPLKLPPGPLTAEDLDNIRFLVVPRGYAMDDVDAVLARLKDQIGAEPDGLAGSESGIMVTNELSDRRNHDGSDETSHG
ncbi:MAG: DivIVA domain-containing protein [Propionibacteriaceae bacterium]|nr:DivIVA domain-containing protein [Propionibacteriaceae bacterium]